MDVILGITTKDSVLIGTSNAFTRGISILKDNDDKTTELNDHELLAFTGEPGDTKNLADYLRANIQLHGIRNGVPMSHRAVSSFIRNELATSLRSRKPYQVQMLVAGYDTKNETPKLNWIDNLAANVELPYAAHGYPAFYVMSLLDRHHKPGISEEDGLNLMKKCVEELKKRMPIEFKGLTVRSVNKEGIKKVADL